MSRREELQRRYLVKRTIEPMQLSPSAKKPEGMSVVDLVDAYRSSSFNAARLAEACDLFGRMIDEGCTIGLTLAGAMTPAGLGGALATMMEAGFIDFIVSTGANLYHDLHNALGFHIKQGDWRVDDNELHEAGIERIYDIFITEEMLLTTDKFVLGVAEQLAGQTLSTAELHKKVGEAALKAARQPDRSMVAQAAKLDVPLFTSSPGDSSIGMNVAAAKLFGKGPTIDPDLDVLQTTAIIHASEKNGVLILGGGSPKNFYLQTQPTLWQILGVETGGHDYVVQVSTDAPHWGGLSGATPQEAISWGKVAKTGHNHVVCYADSTIAAPLIFAHALATRKPRPPKRLGARLRDLVADLRKSVVKAGGPPKDA